MSETTGLILGLSAALAWGVTDLVGTLAARRIGSLRTTAIADMASLVVLAVLFVTNGARLPDDPSVALTALGIGCLAGVAYLAFYTALQFGPLSVVSPVVSLYGGLTVILSILLLGERLSIGQVVGAIVATSGVAFVGVHFERDWRRTRLVGPGVAFGLVCLVAFAFVTVGLAGPIRAAGWLPVLLLSRIGNTILVLVILGLRSLRAASPVRALESAPIAAVTRAAGSPELALLAGVAPRASSAGSVPLTEVGLSAVVPESAPLTRVALGQASATGVLDVVGSTAWAIGLAIAPTWLVGLSSSFGPVVAVWAGVVVLGERPRALQWAGLGLVAVGIVLLALG